MENNVRRSDGMACHERWLGVRGESVFIFLISSLKTHFTIPLSAIAFTPARRSCVAISPDWSPFQSHNNNIQHLSLHKKKERASPENCVFNVFTLF
jgi:hypothetical protein